MIDLSKLEERLCAIEMRLSLIENHLSNTTESPWVEATSITPILLPIQPKESLPAAKPGNWLGLIAVVCFVLAAGFILKLSLESGWLTAEKQIGLAALFGFALIGAGYQLLESDRKYASLLPAAGIIILYCTVFAAYGLYSLASFQTALAMTILISSICIWLYIKVKHDIYAIIAAIGAYTTPGILGLHVTTVFSLYYFIVCSLTFATISIWVQSRLLTMIAAYLSILVTALVGFHLNNDLLIAFILALHFIIFSVGTYFYTRLTSQQLSEKEAWSFFPVLIIFYAMEYYFIDRIEPGLAPWISLGFAGLLIGLYLYAKKWVSSLNSESVIVAFTTLVCFHSIYLELLPLELRPWLFVVIILGSALLPVSYLTTKKPHYSLIPTIAVLIILAMEYLRMLAHLMADFNLAWFIVATASFCSIWVLLIKHHASITRKEEYGYLLLGLAHLLAISGLYQLTTDYNSLAVSASWLFYAICVMSIAYFRKDKIMAKSALFVLGFAAGKALIYDASATPTIIRILCLMLTGVVLYGSGLVIRKIAEWQN
ncbi:MULTISPECIES: DUF2339 domain-containing protein [unclassified Legionella]|uniref:DUF2339 domain-containing protein n=1 Tax=unclassified Legionella TaxID=2622702 RepID=UPI001E424BAF|nr:DUF2339 domain-containing protein [Legionella sp. 31fI33]MCC5013489.1 DUF2339 domain-containing protein [Legionella sp. 31fI33]